VVIGHPALGQINLRDANAKPPGWRWAGPLERSRIYGVFAHRGASAQDWGPKGSTLSLRSVSVLEAAVPPLICAMLRCVAPAPVAVWTPLLRLASCRQLG